MKIKVINGPNLNLLGKRSPGVYGQETLLDLENKIKAHADKCGCDVIFFQSNSEGAIIDELHASINDKTDAVILNAGAYTHYSYAIRDAISALGDCNISTAEVHISDIYKREAFRSISVIKEVCAFSIVGHGTDGYLEALSRFAEEKL